METEDAEGIEDDQKSEESSIDSLDSQAELRKLAKTTVTSQEVEEDTGPPVPDLTQDDLNKLVRYVKKITTLFDLQDTDWTAECEQVIKRFFMDTTQPVLSVYFDDDDLKCVLGFPSCAIVDLTYFIRKPFEIFTPETFHDTITFGTVDDSIEGSILKVVENIYAPIFFHLTTWPDTLRNDICSHLHSFLATFTEVHYKMSGLSVIYIPNEGVNLSVEEAASDHDLIKRLENVVAHWIKQIETGLSDVLSSTQNDLSCLKDEYEFWVYRHENLSGLDYQMQNKNLKKITEILKASHSDYVNFFINSVAKIEYSLVESKSNVEFLQILLEPCEKLAASKTPLELVEHIPDILNIIRFIWMNSPYYNTNAHITTLCRELSNEVIIYCMDYINLNEIFQGNTRLGLCMLETCIQCCMKYKTIYKMMEEIYGNSRIHPWKLNHVDIFLHLESFTQRCFDMTEVCNCMITFGRIDETEDIPEPNFGTSAGRMFGAMCADMEKQFMDSLAQIEKVRDIIMDIQNLHWLTEMQKFHESIKNIEVIVTNITDGIFNEAGNLNEAIEAFAALFNYTKRDTLEPLFSKKIRFIYKMFADEIHAIKNEVATEKHECYAVLPYNAGRAWLAHLKKLRMEYLKKTLDEAIFLPHTPYKKEVYDLYDKEYKAIEEFVRNLYTQWRESLDDNLQEYLDRPLINRSVTKPGLFECNIHRQLLPICHETEYWVLLQMEIPFQVKKIYAKYDTLRLVYEKVLTVVMDYNRIIASLSDEERELFRVLIATAEKKISPGLFALKWNSDISDEYIAECCAYTSELQQFLDDYKKCNLQIVKICEKICDTFIIRIPTSEVYELHELREYIIQYTEENSEKLAELYQDILRYLIVVYEGFESRINQMLKAWDKYIKNFDKLLQLSFRIMVKNSMENVKQALHGDGSTEPTPLLKIVADLRDNNIDFEPSIKDISALIESIRPRIIKCLQPFERLSSKFKASGAQPLPFHQVIAADQEIRELQADLDKEVVENISHMIKYVHSWSGFKSIWELDKDKFMERYTRTNPNADMFDVNIGRYSQIANSVLLRETITVVHFILVNADPLKNSIVEHCMVWQQKLCQLLCSMTEERIENVYHYIEEKSDKIQHVPKTLEEMQESMNLLETLKNETVVQSTQFEMISDQFHTLDKYEVSVPMELREKGEEIPYKWQEYLDILEQAEKMITFTKDTFKATLLESSEQLKKDSINLLDSYILHGPYTSDWSSPDALAYIANMKAELAKLRATEAQLKKDLLIFNISHQSSPELDKLEKDLIALQLVWDLAYEWDTAWNKYKYGEFWTIQTEEMEETAQTLFRKLTRLEREHRDRNWPVIDDTRKRVDEFRRTLPLIADLKNPAMKPRHWTKVRTLMNRSFDENSADFRLEAIIAMRMQEYAEQINDISNSATMELQIESGLENITDTWAAMKIEVVPYKDEGIYRIKSVDECFQTIEENMVSLSTMKSTRHVEPFAKKVDYWERTLSYIMETLENGLTVQRQWLYLENIFFGEDIRKQLPKESASFEDVTQKWKRITTEMYQADTAMQATHYKPPPYLYNKLNYLNDRLETIQRELEKYLEMKRHIFPRFYFISNDDMLEILGNAKKPEAIQSHLKKLFDNLNKIKIGKVCSVSLDNRIYKIGKNISTGKVEAQGMYSEDGEYIDFTTPSAIEGPAESWLLDIEKAMRITLRQLLKPCRIALRKNLKARDRWLLAWSGQLCNTASQIQWTTDCTRTLMQCKVVESRAPLKKLRKRQRQVLSMLSDMSRRDLQKIQRLKVNALSIIEIHAKDVIDKMYKSNCMDVSAFEWFSQLRFYWDRDIDDCLIRQTNTSFRYGYEYNGNSGRLVITPLTDRCYITLTTALHLKRGGSPKGPAGTGKTETVKDLGKALGMWVIVNNCSEGLDYKSMGKMFSGLAQTGAWGCFDEFNRINIEVLSVVAQQILSVLSAIAQRAKKLYFEGQEINLVLTCGIFITMNPGYAGRTELPDNLKSMFRPISMIVPDSIIIAENILFSDGFQMMKILAKKVYTLYQLSMQQLSKQDHYDFGLRSMVALLRYGGRKRRAHPNLPEEEILYLAMRDMNIAKLTADDLPLFNGIMSDIFPGVQIPIIDYEDLNTAIEDELRNMGLQSIKTAITKVIQLYETKNSRHSVMILGKTCTAKTATWKALKGAMGRMKKAKKPGFNMVQEYPLNPKSLSLGELYGEYNLSTGEWLDGVLSAVMRKTCAEETPDEKWILFDGPVDAVWIENMNSVMDDNKVLTLINSERITMPEQVSLLFEVGDLSVASPATVSRCGMVYNDYKDWGWQPYVTSWLQRQNSKEYRDLMSGFFERYLTSVLEYKRLNCEEPVPVCELNSVISLCKLLECFATKTNGLDPSDQEVFETMGKMWFLFCLIWSVCVTVDEIGRKKLDVFIREKDGIFPLKDTIYEYFIDVRNRAFISWEEKLPKMWKYNASDPFYKITVPTVDTVRYECIISALIDAGHPVLMTGPVGTGKTSVAQSVVSSLDPMRYTILAINMSAQTTSNNVQNTIESRVEKRTKGVYVPYGGKKMIAFLDDLNMPAKDTYGSQPPLELLRQWMDYGFWYDRQKQWRISVKDMFILGAMGPPGGGRTVISDRFLSCFNLINMTFPDETQVTRIFDTMLKQHVVNFDETVQRISERITEATIDLYNKVSAKMLPTPTKIHYLFNLRDISKVFQGLLRSNRYTQDSKPSILKLWVHECYRVFFDRLIDDKDREWFNNTMNDQLGVFFEQTLHSLCPNREIPIFGHFMSSYDQYEDLNDQQALRAYLEVQMDEYNASPGVVRIDLVLFRDAIVHICKIVRVISQPRGNMLLVGIGGSGRQSLSRIAAYICEYNTFQIEVKRNYKMPEFREDLKTLYALTGVDSKETAFLFNDTQIAEETFLEVINNMLSSGEVANLYKPDEFEDVKNKLQDAAKKAGIIPTTETLYTFLIERVRKNMHIVLCMSPVGDSFRNRLRQYPALVNCTTIDWFSEWPKVALLEVANKYLKDVNFVQTITGVIAERRRSSVVVSTQERLREAVASIFSIVHDSVAKCSKRMLDELKRHNYVTPTNYLELVTGYKAMLDEKRTEIAGQANKLRNGLSKIESTRAAVEDMSAELEIASQKVVEFQRQCDEYLVVIIQQSNEADEQRTQVTADSIKIKEDEVQCLKLAAVAQSDLDAAMPVLEEAIHALDSLNKKDIAEVRSYGRPPQKVEMVMEAVMILKGVDTSWAEAKRQLADNNFLNSLREFDKNHISEKTLKKIAVYTTNDEFMPDKVGIVSLAAKSLCMWVRAIEKYAKIYRYVAPKQERLELAMASLREKQEMLAAAKRKLDELSERLERLKQEYDEKFKEKEELTRKAEMLRLKLERAALLVDCLSGEKIRWEQTVETLDKQFACLPGDCLLATAFVSYLGPFTSIYRDDLTTMWMNEVTEQDVPHTNDFGVIEFLSDPLKIREWNSLGLPSDAFSVENGIIIVRCSRWPLVIDPQCQAQKWIKQMEEKLNVIDFGVPNFMKTIEKAVQHGDAVLLQNVLEVMDPALTPILQKSLVKQGGQLLIKLSDKMVEYNDNFRFYITTKLSNPHYAPEVSTKTTVVNFAVKEQGLEAQLLGIVVRREQAQMEEQKDKLVTTIATGKRKLIVLEDELLRLLNETRGSLLDDEELVATLKNSKVTSEAVKESLETSETTEARIDLAREGYRPCAKRAAILFFVLYDMSRIDPMYQFSLDSYILLFINSIEKSKPHPVLDTRIEILNEYHTYATYRNTCRGLFENHKLLFSFHMCIKILEAQGKILPHEYMFLLKGGVVLDREEQRDNPCTSWLDDVAWDNITELDKIQGFHGVVDSFEQYPRDWQQWFVNKTPEQLPLIGEWEDICNEFQRMLFIRSLRQDRLPNCVSTFIINNLGPQFVEPPVLDVKAVLEESLPQTPLIFVLSPGVDPTTALIQLAETNKMSDRFHSLSLGQGQAPFAKRMIDNGIREGHWVFLANCHLSLSWMPALDKIVETLQTSKKINPGFRMWLSSSPHPDFPISILQAGIKMTTEPPKGLKANLKRLYRLVTEEQFYACKTASKYRKLLFSLCFFHSILLERKKFQQLGWNIVYSFNDSDFEVSECLLTIYLDEYEDTPWDALKYLIAGVNYGGHVTDDWDRRLLTTYINQYFNDDALNTPFYRLSTLTTYYIPKDGNPDSYMDFINILPTVDNPEAFGQHSNADITSLITEARCLCETLMSLQVQASGGEQESKEEKVAQLAADVLAKIPAPIDYENTVKIIGEQRQPLEVVLLQEISRYNVLLTSIQVSLEELQRSIKGLVVMSSELEDIFICIFEGRVPANWLKAYPSLKLLGSWTRDLILRVEHFSQWAEKARAPLLFWLSAYTFPTGFLTAVLQTAARSTQVPIDQLSWDFSVMTTDENLINERPDIGVYVRGMYLEGAGWNKKTGQLVESQPMQLISSMPLIHFKPMENVKKKNKGMYVCPCYYYPIRAGMQGRPAYVVAVDLKCTDTADFWIKRGTALLLSLAN